MSEQRNGNGGKWEARWVWATRVLIGLLTWLALTIWNDLRAVAGDVATLTTNSAVQSQRLDDHDRRLDDHGQRIGAVEGRVYARQGG